VVETSWNTLKFYDDVWLCAPVRIKWFAWCQPFLEDNFEPHSYSSCSSNTNTPHTNTKHVYTYVLPYAPCLASICIPERHIAGFVATRNPETDTPTSASLERFKAHIGQLFGWYGSANGLHQDKARNRKNLRFSGSPTGDSFREEKANWEAQRWWSPRVRLL
jgi:hypothetical protein